MTIALKVDEAKQIRDMGVAADVTYSSLLAALIRIGLAHLDELPPSVMSKEHLQLSAFAPEA